MSTASKEFLVIYSDGIMRSYTATKDKVESEFASLEHVGEEYVYKFNNGLGKGTLTIPGHIMYDLPELFAMLTKMNPTLVDTTVVVEKKNATILFKPTEE